MPDLRPAGRDRRFRRVQTASVPEVEWLSWHVIFLRNCVRIEALILPRMSITACNADLWPRRIIFSSRFITATSQYRSRQDVDCSSGSMVLTSRRICARIAFGQRQTLGIIVRVEFDAIMTTVAVSVLSSSPCGRFSWKHLAIDSIFTTSGSCRLFYLSLCLT